MLHLEVVHVARSGLRLVEMDAVYPLLLLFEAVVIGQSRQFVHGRRASVFSGAALSIAPSVALPDLPQA